MFKKLLCALLCLHFFAYTSESTTAITAPSIFITPHSLKVLTANVLFKGNDRWSNNYEIP